MITKIRGTSHFAIFIAIAALLGFSVPASATSVPQLCNTPSSLNYGNLNAGQTKVLAAVFKNCGTANLIVSSAITFNGWSTVSRTPIVVAPGMTTSVTVTVTDSSLHNVFPGLYTDRLILTTNGGNSTTVLVVGHIYGYHNTDDTITIANLNNRISTLNAQVSDANTSIVALKAQITALQMQLAVLNAQISTANTSIAALNAQITSLQTQLATPVQGLSQVATIYCPGYDSSHPCITPTGYNSVDGYVHEDDTTKVSEGWIRPRLKFTIYPYSGATYGITPACAVSYQYPQNAGNKTGGITSFGLPTAPSMVTVDQPLGFLARDSTQHVLVTVVCSGNSINQTFSLDYKWFPS